MANEPGRSSGERSAPETVTDEQFTLPFDPRRIGERARQMGMIAPAGELGHAIARRHGSRGEHPGRDAGPLLREEREWSWRHLHTRRPPGFRW